MSYERKQYVGNAAQTQLTAGITDTGTSITIDNATSWPDGSGGPFIIAIDLGAASEEKILCTGRVGTTITVRAATGRGHDDTAAQAHSLGATVDHVLDAETIDQVNRLANLMTTKGDLIAGNGTNPVRVGNGAIDDTTDGYVFQTSWAAATGWVVARLVSLLAQAGAPDVAGTVRLWYDTTNRIIRPSDGSSWLIPNQVPSVASSAARDELIAAPVAGNIVWRSDLNFLELYNATKWRPVDIPQFASTAARDAYYTTPLTGDFAYITGTHTGYVYRNNEWIINTVKIVVSATQPASPQTGDVWLQPVT